VPKYLIEVSHPEDRLGCAKAIQVFLESGSHYLTHAEWGCGDDVHCGWMIVEAANREEVEQILPPACRDEARIVRLKRFTPEEIDTIVSSHEE